MTMRHPYTLTAAVTLAALLAGCAGQQTRSLPAYASVCDVAEMSVVCSATLAAHKASVAARGDDVWSMQARAAISTGKNAGNARIDWQQHGPLDYSVTLSAPITRQSWQLDVANQKATITGLEGGPRSGVDAATLLREATGWDIPVQSMRFWLRGTAATHPVPTGYVFGSGTDLIRLDQDGWRIDFEQHRSDGLPGRITATRGDSRVRLVIDQWSDATGG